MDVGAECSDYATDVTRTVPVNGKFTPRQREIYDIVLGAQKAAIAAMKPGANMRGEGSLTRSPTTTSIRMARICMATRWANISCTAWATPWAWTFTIPAIIGTLKAGMVITIEPGIYIPEENIGVRIEDTLLVTETGSKNLSGALPHDPDEIERLVGK